MACTINICPYTIPIDISLVPICIKFVCKPHLFLRFSASLGRFVTGNKIFCTLRVVELKIMNMIPWWNIFHVDVNLSIAEFFWLAQLFVLFLIGFFLHEPKLWDFQFSHLFLSQSFWQFDFVFYWNILITRGPIAPDVLHSILHALQKLITHLNGLWAKNNIVNWRRDQ